ncbi:titin-like isoform X2 [Syngnathoides biaculeatus]|uniref:titin-like isoform X2 n=1 Tax=Syngnathoides biaculeatus TaxID=300417 RepID=UPI002ADD477D|nr:titin-like isoform X2 [Syngnathoides biaculeatus]
MTLTWCKPMSDGGTPITGYVIERREKMGMHWIRVNRDQVTECTTVATKLRKGCEYDFRVYAENAAGLSPPSETSALCRAVDPLAVPVPPSKPKIVNSTKESVSIGWKPPTDNGGAPVLGYSVEYRDYIPKQKTVVAEDEEEYEGEEEESPEELQRWVQAIALTKSLEFTITGLKPDMVYEFCVKAVNKVGSSERSRYSDAAAAVERTVEPAFNVDIEMRKVLVVQNGTAFTLNVSFKGKPVPSVEWAKEGSDLKARGTIDSTNSSTSLTIEKSTRNDSGEYCVSIESSLGKATLPIVVKVLDSPGPPVNVKVSAVTRESATLTWEAPENDGGDAVKAYHVEKREASKKAWVSVTSNCHALMYKVEALLEGAIYYFRVIGENEYGVGVPQEAKAGTKITEVPSVPMKLGVANVTKDSVTICWTRPEYDGGSRVKGYLVDALEKGQTNWVKCATVRAMSHTIKSLREGTEYFFRVRAENHAGLSEPKEMIVPVLVKELQEAPEFDLKNYPKNTVYVRAGANLTFDIPMTGKPMPNVTLSKNNVAIKGSKRLLTEVTPDSLTFTLNESMTSDAGKYEVTASNLGGATKIFMNVIVLDKPGPPVGPVEIGEVGETTAYLKWAPPEYDGGSPVTNYLVLRRETSTPTWTEMSSNIARSEFKATKLTKGEEYQFRIKAQNRYGVSDHIDSKPVMIKLPFTFPGPPSTPWVSFVCRDNLTVCWNEPVNDGGNPVIGYHLQMKERSSILWQKINKMAVPGNQLRVTNICPGLIYEFKVAAENAAGIGKMSKISEEVLAIDACEPPANVHVTEVTKNSVSLSWQRPPYDGGSKITGYSVERREAASGRWVKANFSNIPEMDFTVSGLNQNESYEFRVYAKNALGSVSNPSLIAGPVTCIDACGAPALDVPPEYLDVVQYKAGTSVKIRVRIIAKPQPSIEWLKNGKELVASSSLCVESTTDSSAVVIKDATRKHTGSYQVKIKNILGSATATIAVEILDKPGPPAGSINFTLITADRITFRWEPVSEADLGGSQVTHYIVERRETSRVVWSTISESHEQTYISVGKLVRGNEYVFRVMAVNKYGIGVPLESEAVVAKNAFVTPGQPHTPEVNTITKTTMVVEWEGPGIDGGSTVTGYYLERRDKKSLRWIRVCKDPIPDNKQTVYHLTEGNDYQYRVCAINKAGEGPFSDVSDFYKAADPIDPPDEPCKLKVMDSTKTSITLGWSKPEWDGGSEVTSYMVEKLNEGEEDWAMVTSKGEVKLTEYTVHDLKPDVNYFFRVSAVNCVGLGEPLQMTEPVQAKDILEEAQIDSDVATRTHYIVKAGKDVELSVPLKGRPSPCASWSKGDVCIDNNPSFEFHHSDTTTVLIMREVTKLDTGKYTVKIENGVGEPKTLTLSVKVQDSPSQCRNLTLKEVTSGKVTLCWESPLLDGGAEITNYIIEKRDSSKRSYSTVTSKCTDTIYTIEDLSEKTSYFFRLLAENENGVGEPCETLEPVKATQTPGPVKDVSMKDSSKSSVSLQWLKPDYDGGSIISDYIIEKKTSDEEWTLGGTSRYCEFEVKKLKEHSDMFFRVAARNEKGQGDFVKIGPIKVIDYVITPEASLADYPDGRICVRLGHNVHIELPYKGKPKPTVFWLKDNLPLKESNEIRFKKTENKATLMIKNVKKENEGKFTLTLDNKINRKSFHIHVITLGPPSKPLGPIRLDEVRAESVTISWDEPQDDGGGEINCYSVEKRDTSQPDWKMACSSVEGTQFKVPNLIKGVQYQFRVCAENRYGVSEPLVSQTVIAKHQFRPPGPPGKPVVYNITNDGMTIQWEKPIYDGGTPIQGFHVEKREKNSFMWQKVNMALIRETEYRISDLIEGLEYSFRVYAQNDAGCSRMSDESKPTMAVSPVDPPGQPDYTDVTSDSITLKWDAPKRDGGSKITGYNIEKRQRQGRWFKANLNDVHDCQYTVTGLTMNERYEFRVIARNAIGVVSPPSNSSGLIVVRSENAAPHIEFGPEYFEGLTVKAGDNIKVKVAITGRPVPKVLWYRDGVEITKRMLDIITIAGCSTLFIRDADRSHRGLYTVEATNGSGVKKEDLLVQVQDTPGEPVGPITFSNISEGRCTLSWNPPENDGCSEITHYIIEKRETSKISWALVSENCRECTFSATKLIKINEYQFRVSAVNRFGVGRPLESCPIIAQLQYTTPNSPGTPDATEITGESITLAWTPPTFDGGNPIHFYILEKREKKTVRFYKVLSKKPITECAHKVINLTEDMEYEFRVMAVNDAGVGAPSNISLPIKAVEPKDIPCAPSVVCVSDSTGDSISLEWTKPADDGGSDILGYIVEMVKNDETDWNRVNTELVPETEYKVTGLHTGVEYKFRVAAVNQVGRGEDMATLEPAQAIDRLTPPEVDIDATFKQMHIVKAGGSVKLSVQFRGKPVPVATWLREEGEGELSAMSEVTTAEGISTLHIENCSRNDSGKYTVNLQNSSGSEAIIFTVKVMDTPGAPQALAFQEVSRGSVTLAWDPPINDGGARIHHYIVERREATRRTWQQSGGKCTQNIMKIQDLLEGVPYFFRVSAENQYGVGEVLEITEPVIATAEPGPPKRMDIVDTTDSSVSLSWLKPEYDGGSRIQCYVIEARPKGTDKWVVVGNTKNLSYTVEKLNKGDEYHFRVKAKNESGLSRPREIPAPVLVKEPHIEPAADLSEITNQLITCRSGSTFTIDVPISGRPAPKVTWRLEEMRLKNSERVSIKVTKDRAIISVKDAMRGDGGKYHLTLENVAGSKTFTIDVNVTGRPSPPKGPVEISNITSESCVVNWDAPEDDGGTDITNYIVEKRESGSTAWQLINSSVKHTSLHVSHLTKYMQYTFRVSAENRFGVSKPAESETIVAEHSYTPPGPPTRPLVFNISANTMTLKWEEPYHDGGSKVTGYWIEKKERNNILWVRENKIPCFECFYKVDDLVESLEYQFRVYAMNSAGLSKASEASKGAIAQNPVDPPGKPEVTKVTRTTVSLKWLTPLNDGGSPIVGYIIERKPYTLTGEGRWLKCNYTNVVDNFYTVTALGEGEPYEFRVIAKNANQVFSTPSESTGSVQCKIDFEPPKAQLDSKLLSEVVMVRAGSDLVLDAAVGGRPDPKASWSKGNRELELCDKYHLQYTSNRAMAIIKFCDRDDTGKYILTVRNVSGTKTAEVNVKVLDTPGVCEGSIEISRITEESCTLSWKPPLEDGGDEVSHYLVERRDTNRLNWVFMHAECKDLICNITGLLKNTEYLFRVRGVNKYGAGIPLLSEAMVARNTFTVPTPPGAPEILVSGKDFATIEWLKPESDGGSPLIHYLVERREKKSARWVKVNRSGAHLDTMLKVSGLAEGSIYQFRVTAINKAGESEPSEVSLYVVCRVPTCTPSPPSVPRITDTHADSISLAWSRPVEDGGADVLGYILEMQEVGKEEWTKAHEKTLRTSEHMVTGLCSGKKYCFRVAGININGTGDFSERCTETEPVERIETPDFELHDDLKKTICLRAGGCLRLFVNITGRPAPTIAWSKPGVNLNNRGFIEVTHKSTTLIIDKVHRYDAGKYTIVAENSAGKQEVSLLVKVYDTPGPTGPIKIKELTKEYAIISWEGPTVDGGAPVNNYIVERREASMRAYKTVTSKCSKTSFKIDGLMEGMLYYFRVLPENIYGVGEPCETADVILVCEVPHPPRKLEVVDITKTTVSLSWEKPEHDGGSRLIGYVVEACKFGTEKWMKVASLKLTDFEHTIEKLNEKEQYLFRIKAINSRGASEAKELVTPVTVQEQRVMPAVDFTNIPQKAVNVEAGKTLELDMPIIGRPPPSCCWFFGDNRIKITDRVKIQSTGKFSKLTMSDTTIDDTGNYTLEVKNTVGVTTEVIKVVILSKPDEPKGPIRFDEIDATTVTCSWDPPPRDGGAPISGYVVEQRDAHRPGWVPVCDSVSRPTFKFENLIEGDEYVFRAAAVNRYGTGEFLQSEIVTCRSLKNVSGCPGRPTILDVSRDGMTVAWNPPEEDGGLEVSGYIIERKEVRSDRWVRANKNPITMTRYRSTELIEGLEYEHRIIAINARGISKPSLPSKPAVASDPIDPPGCPQNPRITETTKSSVSLAWSPPDDEGDARVDGYLIEMQKVGTMAWLKCNTTPSLICEYTLTNMLQGEEFKFRILACNVGGSGEPAEVPGTVTIREMFEPPDYELELKYKEVHVVRHGGVVRLSLPIKGKPQPTCSWFKDGGTVSTKAMVAHTEDTSELVIKGAERSDSGVYELLLENKVGKKKVQIKVNVIGRPSAPEGPLVFEEIQANSVKVSWKVPTDNGGTEILGYIVERREVTRNAWYTVDSKVTAENSFGIGPSLKSEQPLLPKTPLCPPEPSSAPPEIMDVTKNSVALGWYRPKDDGGSTITGYFIEYKEVSTEQWSRHPTKIMSTMFTQSGLTADANYHFRIVAVNDVGESEAGPVSDPVICKDPFDKPSQPGEIDTTNVTNKLITISWQAPECDGGKVVQGYWVEYRKSTESSWKKCNKQRVKELEFTMVGLAEATEYEFRVFAENETGISRPRRTATCIKTKLGVETKPSLRKEIDEVTEKLGQPAVMKCQIIGRPVPEIRWYHAGREIVESRKYEMTSDGRNHSLSIMTDQQEDEGAYTCKATNDAGEAETTGILVLEAAPSFHSDYPLKNTYYAGLGTTLRIHAPYIGRPVPKIMWLQEAKTLETSEDISIETTEYYSHLIIKNVQRRIHGGKYRIRLHNHFGRVDAAFKVEIYDKPDMPQGPIVMEALLKNSVIISWKPPKDDGGCMITNYIVEKREDNQESEWELVSSSIHGTSCRVPNLTDSAGYFFRVYAQNRYGNSEPLEQISPILIKSQLENPSPPQAIVVSGITKDSCVVCWKPPLSDGGSKIKSYCLEKKQKKDKKEWGEWTPVTTDEIKQTVFSVKHLSEGIEYVFRVKCENLGGESDYSEESSSIVPATAVDVQAPAFKEELRNMSVKYKSNATLVCKITGQPKPVIKWFRRGKEIHADEKKIKIQEFKGGYHQLVIAEVDEEDSTVYQIRATNQGGSICATISLDVEIPATIHLPKNLKDKEAIPALRGEMVNIKIPFGGKPDPVITWQKGQDLIDSNGHYQVIVTRSFTSLVFPHGVEKKDAGFYIVCAKNRFGIDQQTVELDVADVPDPPRGLKASDISRDSVTLNWVAPANDGGSKVISYIIEKCPTTAERWERVAQSRDSRYTVINLFGGTSYQFRVIAKNKFGKSSPSETSGPVMTKEDKSRVLLYDREVDDMGRVPKSKAQHSDAKNLCNKFSIAEELGRGQFGIVHRCVNISSEKTYMAKFVKVRGADQAVVKKEIATLNLAKHTNFLLLHESFDSPEELVMIYDFISGVDIFERLTTSDFELNEQEIVNYIRQICSALEFLHGHSYGHFDIRPENIVYTTRTSSNVKIIELGQSRHLTPGDQIRIQYTTAEYAAPEIHQGDMVSTVTDMWSVGVLAYVLLCGLNPFTAETNQQMIDNISNAAYSYDDECFKQVSVEALDFTDRLMTKERKHRMTATEALVHPWLSMPAENLSTRTIQSTRHKRYYQTMAKKEWSTTVSAARVASGGSIRSQRGVLMAKVKIAPFEHGPVAGQIRHSVSGEGDSVKFICNIDNYDSTTEVTWYCGVRQLEASEKYKIQYEDGLAVITITKVTRADDGTYRCKVVNEYGEDSAYAELFVKGVRSFRDFFTTRVVKRTKRRIDTARMLQKPPEFTFPLINHTAYTGEDVRFSVTITVHPDPRVTWHKSGQKLIPGEEDKKYTFIVDKGLYQLIIHSVDDNDDAEYSVVARNRFGDDSCKARLTVIPRPKPADLTLRPMFKRLLANIECREGQNVRFEIRVSGHPTLKWEKDGTPIAFGPSIELVHEGLDYFILHVRDTLPEDSGVYRVTATNSAGSASCQATLKVERVSHVKRDYEGSQKEHKSESQKEVLDKKVRLYQILSDTVVIPLPPAAVQAVREAATMFKPAVTTKKSEKGEAEIQKEKEERKKRADEKRLRMPYDVPTPRVMNPAVLEEDVKIKHFKPLSDMKWYKKLRDQYEFPDPKEKIKQKRMKRIRLSRWEQFYEVPIRIKDQYKPRWHIPSMTQDDLEMVRPSRHRAISPEIDIYHRIRRRSLGDLSDEELLLPVNEYLSMKRTEEERLRLEGELELGYSASPPSLSPVRFALSSLRPSSPVRVYSDDEETEVLQRYDSYRIPSKYEAGPSFVELRQRHDKATYKPPRQKQRVYEEREDQELLRPHITSQRIASYKSELKRMECEEKTRNLKQETVISVTKALEDIESEHLTILASEYIPKPIKKLPRPDIERKAPSSEKAVKTEMPLPRVNFLSRYEERKRTLRSERRSVERTSEGPLSLDHIPRISIRLRSHRVPYCSNANFTLNVQAKPEPSVEWFHNGREIKPSSKHHMSNISGLLTLQINNCMTDDAGTYSVVCRNIKGETSDSATLDVAAEYPPFTCIHRDEEPPFSHLPDPTKTEVYHISSEAVKETVPAMATKEIAIVEKEKAKPMVLAKILTKPQSLSVEEGAFARFSCEVDGDPTPSILWLHEGATLGSSSRHHIVSTQHTSSLEIFSVQMSDEGNYALIVENAVGKQEAHFMLNIRKSESKPEVVVSPRVTSPDAKSPEPVKTPQRIKSPEPIQSPLRVKSPVSPKSPTAKSPPPTISQTKSAKRVTSPTVGKKSPTSMDLEQLKCGTPPHFLSQPRSLNVEEGQSVKFTCEIAGEPFPDVEWFKDNLTLSGTSNVRMNWINSVYTLEICKAKLADSGKYTIKAKNQLGQCSATSSLNVFTGIEEETRTMMRVEQKAGAFSAYSAHMKASSRQAATFSSIESMSETGNQITQMCDRSHVEASSSSSSFSSSSQRSLVSVMKTGAPPQVTALPENIKVAVGTSLMVTGTFSGDPTPSVQWLHSDQMLPDGDNRHHVDNTADISTLVIAAVKENDGGVYTLRVSNQLGSASATVNVHIQSM